MLGIFYTDSVETTEKRASSNLFKVTITDEVGATILVKPLTNQEGILKGLFGKYILGKVSVMPESVEEVTHTYTLSAAPILAGTYHTIKETTGVGELTYVENMIEPVNGHYAEYPIKLEISAEVTGSTDIYVYILYKEL